MWETSPVHGQEELTHQLVQNDGEEYERQLTANDSFAYLWKKDQLKEEVTNLQLFGY